MTPLHIPKTFRTLLPLETEVLALSKYTMLSTGTQRVAASFWHPRSQGLILSCKTSTSLASFPGVILELIDS